MRILAFSLLAISIIFIESCRSANSKNSSNPNILIIVADDLGWNDVGFHGSDVKTPALDAFAKESMEFNRFYTSAICSPTRAGLLTGKYPDRFNLRGHVYSPRHIGGIPPEVKMLPELLRNAGYGKIAAFGKWHLGHSDIKYHPNSQGFDSFYGHYNGAIDYFTHMRDLELDWHRNNKPSFEEGYSTDLIGQDVVKFINHLNDDNKPFFAYVAFNAPHSPMQAKREDLKEYGYDSEKPINDYPVGGSRSGERGLDKYGMQGRGNTLRQTYAAMVSAMDKKIGDILRALEKNNLKKNTIVWFMSDNGGTSYFGGDNTPLRGGKHTQWEGGVRVVSLMRWPDKTEPSSNSNQLIAYIDVAPTLYKIANGNSEVDFDGVDITDALEGKPLPDRYLYLGGSGIVSQKWKMNKGELFRIEKDPNEKRNIAGHHEDVVEMLDAKLEAFKRMRPDTEVKLHPDDWQPPENWTMPE